MLPATSTAERRDGHFEIMCSIMPPQRPADNSVVAGPSTFLTISWRCFGQSSVTP
jgi:hypothetical protein